MNIFGFDFDEEVKRRKNENNNLQTCQYNYEWVSKWAGIYKNAFEFVDDILRNEVGEERYKEIKLEFLNKASMKQYDFVGPTNDGVVRQKKNTVKRSSSNVIQFRAN